MTALKRCSSSRSTLPTSLPRRWSAKHRKVGRSCQPSTGTLEPITRHPPDKQQPDPRTAVLAELPAIRQQPSLTSPHTAPCRWEAIPLLTSADGRQRRG